MVVSITQYKKRKNGGSEYYHFIKNIKKSLFPKQDQKEELDSNRKNKK